MKLKFYGEVTQAIASVDGVTVEEVGLIFLIPDKDETFFVGVTEMTAMASLDSWRWDKKIQVMKFKRATGA